MAKGKDFREVQEDYSKQVVGLCCVCEKQVTGGWYGRWGNVGTCSKKCETVQEAKPKYPPPKDEELLINLSEQESDS